MPFACRYRVVYTIHHHIKHILLDAQTEPDRGQLQRKLVMHEKGARLKILRLESLGEVLGLELPPDLLQLGASPSPTVTSPE